MEAPSYYQTSNITKAWFAIEKATEHFRELGFEVSEPLDPSVNGVDLRITKSAGDVTVTFSVEVKAVGHSKGSWRSRGRYLRTGDDFIAYVFPNGRVWVEDHASHERLRCADGGRHLTKIGKLYG